MSSETTHLCDFAASDIGARCCCAGQAAGARESRRAIDFAAVALILATVSGCAPRTPIQPGTTYQPDRNETRLWEASREEARKIRDGGLRVRDAALEAYVQSVLDRVMGGDPAGYAPLTPRVYVLDSPSVNAFTFPHGEIFVHTGILGRLRSEGQLAMLLGHEITHATHRHADQLLDDMYARTAAHAYISLLASFAGQASDLLTIASALVTQSAISGYSREKEEEADAEGLQRMARAGYDANEGVVMFQRMLDAADEKAKKWNFLYATHPKMKERVKSCRKLLGAATDGAPAARGDVGADRYFSAATPLIAEEARRHVGQGRFDLARQTVAWLLAMKPGNAEWLSLAGDVERASGESGASARAVESYETALAADARNAAANRGLGLTLLKLGQRERAAVSLRKYLDIAPDAADAAYVRSCLSGMAESQP